MTNSTMNRPAESDDPDSEVDLAHIKNLVGLLIRSPKRHPWLAAVMVVLGVLIGVAAGAMEAKVYMSEAAVRVEKDSPLYVVAGMDRQGSLDLEHSSAGTEILSRDNLVSLVRAAHLAEWTTRPKSGLARVKQVLLKPLSAFSPKQTPAELEESLVVLLRQNLWVRTDGSTLIFGANWWDPDTARGIANLAQQSFFTARRAAEVTAISDGIASLEDHAKSEREEIDEALELLKKARAGLPSSAARLLASTTERSTESPVPATANARPAAPRQNESARRMAASELARALDDTRRQLRELQDDRHRRLAELRTQQAGLLSTYTPAHPAVASVQSRIDALSSEPPTERQLKAEERQLLDKIAATAGEEAAIAARRPTGGGGVETSPTTATGASTASPLSGEALTLSAPAVSMALGALQSRIHKYEDTINKIAAARLQLDFAEKAFTYRYSIFKPAEVPTKPIKSNRTLLMAVGAPLGLLLAALASIFSDFVGGRILESWQVNRKHGLRLLGEANEP